MHWWDRDGGRKRWRGRKRGRKGCVLSQNRTLSCVPAAWTQWISCQESFFPDLYGLPPLVFADTINMSGIIFSHVSTSESSSLRHLQVWMDRYWTEKGGTSLSAQIKILTRKGVTGMRHRQAAGYYSTIYPLTQQTQFPAPTMRCSIYLLVKVPRLGFLRRAFPHYCA